MEKTLFNKYKMQGNLLKISLIQEHCLVNFVNTNEGKVKNIDIMQLKDLTVN